MTLDKKLARLRKREGLSQAEVSEALDVSRQAVTKWETGTSRPSIENLQSLSRLYNVPLEYLLDESGDELPAPAAPAAERAPEQKVQKKEKQWMRLLVIGAVVLALLVCFLFWYGRGQKENGAVFPLRPLQLILENRQQRSQNQEPQASLILRFLRRA